MTHIVNDTNDPLLSAAWSSVRADLREFAARYLPAAVIPSRFVLLNELPRLANGKVDRNSLVALPRQSEGAPDSAPPETDEEIRIAGIWSDLLNVDRIGLYDDFFFLGGTSMTAVQLMARVKATLGVEVSLRSFFENATVAGIAQQVGGKRRRVGSGGIRTERSLPPEALVEEARLPDDVAPAPDAAPAGEPPYAAILVTGGTGYTGAYLLRELLDRSDSRLFVLVRARTRSQGQQRLLDALDTYGLRRAGDEARLVPVLGDLGQPYFGLDRSTYRNLEREAEMIVHNGALSSYALSYRLLKPVNVLGTLEVLRLACRTRIKPVHYVSSLAVYPGRPGSPVWLETEATDPVGVIGGYRQTKWVGDAMMHEAGRRGLPVTVYRPGLITGDTVTGACSTDTFINASIKGCVQLGATFPFEAPLEATPVDYCAAAIAHIALKGRGAGRVYNLPGARPMTPPELFERVADFGYPMRRIPYPDWYAELSAALDRGEENELVRFLPLFGEERPSDEMGFQGSLPRFDTTQLQDALAGSGIACPDPGRALWDLYLGWFVAHGYLPSPDEARRAFEARAGRGE